MALHHLSKGIIAQRVRQYSCCINVNDAYIISGTRTPIGRFQGKLASLNSVQLGVKALIPAIERSCISKEAVEEIVLGQCFQTGAGQLPAHQIALHSGLSNSILSYHVNKLCGSGLKAVISATQLITTNTQEVVVAGGVESVTHIPYILKRQNLRLGHVCLRDLIFHDGLNDMFDPVDITNFAEETVKEFKITREEQDDYAIESFARLEKAQAENMFADEIVPVVLKKKNDEEEVVCQDEVKQLNIEKLRKLKPDIGKDGTITPGNSSGLNDGAAMLVLASGNYVLKKNLKPLARIVSYAEGSLDRRKFCISPSVAIPRALVKANLTADQIYLWEINETFGLTAIINTKILNLNPDCVNVHGGSVSLGHPFGMTGVRLVVHLAHVLPPGALGCACISYGSGGASAVIIEKMC